MDIVSGIAAASQAINIAKALREIEKSYDVATTKAQLVEIIEKLSDAKLALVDAKEIEVRQKAEIDRLLAAAVERAALVAGPNGYKYIPDEKGEPCGYPVCPRCEQVDHRVIRMVPNAVWYAGRCPACGNEYNPIDPIGTDAKRKAEETDRRSSAAIRDAERNLGWMSR